MDFLIYFLVKEVHSGTCSRCLVRRLLFQEPIAAAKDHLPSNRLLLCSTVGRRGAT